MIDWKTWLFEQAKELAPLKLEEIILDDRAFEGLLDFEKQALDKQRRGLRLLPKTETDWQTAIGSQPSALNSSQQFLAVASVKKGGLRCDFYDRKEKSIVSIPILLHPLIQSETGEAELFLPPAKQKSASHRPCPIMKTFERFLRYSANGKGKPGKFRKTPNPTTTRNKQIQKTFERGNRNQQHPNTPFKTAETSEYLANKPKQG